MARFNICFLFIQSSKISSEKVSPEIDEAKTDFGMEVVRREGEEDGFGGIRRKTINHLSVSKILDFMTTWWNTTVWHTLNF